jgi:hypothetical protein
MWFSPLGFYWMCQKATSTQTINNQCISWYHLGFRYTGGIFPLPPHHDVISQTDIFPEMDLLRGLAKVGCGDVSPGCRSEWEVSLKMYEYRLIKYNNLCALVYETHRNARRVWLWRSQQLWTLLFVCSDNYISLIIKGNLGWGFSFFPLILRTLCGTIGNMCETLSNV